MRAHQIFRHAASFFGDREAQYQVGRMYLYGTGIAKDPVQAARWLRLAADAGQRNAQALLGSMLFKGTDVTRQAAMGLFWLTVAKDAVKDGGSADDKWIIDSHASAFAQATDDERDMALGYLEGWMRTRR
jgi:TPR repeat protein